MTHTPGPWYANGDCIEAAGEEGPRDRTIAVVHGTDQHANARLIAASPALLAACKLALEVGLQDYVKFIMSAAINHAEGRDE